MSGAMAESSAEYMRGSNWQESNAVAGATSTAEQTDCLYTGSRVSADVEYTWEYHSPGGCIEWTDTARGLVPTAALNYLLNAGFRSGGVASWYVGLIDGAVTPVYDAADTQASHAGWTEFTGVSNVNWPAFTPDGAAAGGAIINSASRAVFTINADGNVAGSFLTSTNVKGSVDPAEIVYDEVNMTEGAHQVFVGGTLRVTVRLSITAA